MRYVSWAALYEGPSDALYLDVLLPRIIRDLIANEGTELVEVPDAPAVRLGTNGRSVEKVAAEACSFRGAIDVIFIHADTGGRNLEQALTDRSDAYCIAFGSCCDWPGERCITMTPRHETEAWLIADSGAVTAALGYTGDPAELGLPGDARGAERLPDPKQVLRGAIDAVAGRRRGQRIDNLFPAVAQRQRLDLLRGSASFVQFETRLRRCLQAMGCIG
jgi:hypothetical protein